MWSKLQSSQQVCLNMTKQASGPPEPNKQTCPNMSAHRLSNMFVKTWLKQASGPPEPKSKARKLVCKLDKTMPVLLHQIAAAATLYSSTRPLQSKPIRSQSCSTRPPPDLGCCAGCQSTSCFPNHLSNTFESSHWPMCLLPLKLLACAALADWSPSAITCQANKNMQEDTTDHTTSSCWILLWWCPSCLWPAIE